MDPTLLLFAFSAGAIGFFAPCCVAMLPAYVGYAVRSSQQAPETPLHAQGGRLLFLGGLLPFALGGIPLLLMALASLAPLPYELVAALPNPDLSLALLILGTLASVGGILLLGKARAAARGALFGGLATLGFLTIFLAVGLPIALLARGLAPYLNWLAALVGLSLVVLGLFVLAGKSIAPKLPGLQADVTSPKGFYLFGLGYGVASLSCTFPVFLAVVAGGALSGGFLSALAAFAAYALGKGALLVGVTILTVSGGTTSGARVRRLVPAMARASGILLVLAGAYLAWYYGRFAPGISSI